MPDTVKADVRAVRALRSGVARYADQLRASAAAARRDIAAAEAACEEATEQRRTHATRASLDLAALREAARRPDGQQRTQDPRAIAQAEQRLARAEHDLAQARAASRAVSTTASELAKVLQAVDATVYEHSSATASMLASLDGKLSEITGGGVAAFVRGTVTSIGVAAELAVASADLSQLAGNVSQGHLPTAETVTSAAQMNERHAEQLQQLWRDAEETEHRP